MPGTETQVVRKKLQSSRAESFESRRLKLQIKALEARLAQYEEATVFSLSTLLDLKDIDTGTHATRLAEWAVRVAEQLGLDEAELKDIEIASLLHDVGKVGVPDEILGKPGPLTADEFEEIKKHSEYGWTVVRLLPGFERVSLFILHHHERVDGLGYPAGLRADEIPLGAQIVAVVDAFDAMVSDRPYRAGLSHGEALARLRADSGSQFNRRIVDLFTEIVSRSEVESGFPRRVVDGPGPT